MGYTGEKHGHCKGPKRSLTYRSWCSMLRRCQERHKSRDSYFYKGITVCERWLLFENFLEDMGERVQGTTLDRIDNALGYCKENCRWSTYAKQAQNRSSTALSEELVIKIWELKSQSVSLSKIAKQLNINESTVKNVIYRGDWSIKGETQ